ncbi:hypothetical protein [Nocardioides scoriae]|uniref:hypothetical protein n=1 Tax=Nocardioides scoriae TaxID=642780 RepID=UPI0012F92B30|nr:hypothetical protein [Nocardioides scoriae]
MSERDDGMCEGPEGLEVDPATGYLPSPVPSDRRLWPGERPFTAFGHLGVDMLDLRVFDQDVWWVSRVGEPHRLGAMSEEYVENVIAFLVECAETYFVETQRRWFIQTMGDQLLFGEPGADVLAVAAGAPVWSDLDAITWLESTPLMRALRSRLAGRG